MSHENHSVAGVVTVIIVNYRTADYALDCVRALLPERITIPSLRAVIVDGGSADGSAETLKSGLAHPELCDWCDFLPLDFNGGFGWANNQAMMQVMAGPNPPAYFHLLNPDTVIEAGAVSALVTALEAHPKAGAAGSQLLEPDGRLAGSAFRFPSIAREFASGMGAAKIARFLGISSILIESPLPCRAEWVTGASVMFRRSALLECGLFDDGFFLYFEEVELMHRMSKRGWDIWFTPNSRVVHMAGASTGVASGSSHDQKPYPRYWFESRRRFFTRVYGRRGAWLASAAWLLGAGVRQILALFRSKAPSSLVPGVREGIWSVGLRATARDLTPSFPTVDRPLGQLPLWARDP